MKQEKWGNLSPELMFDQRLFHDIYHLPQVQMLAKIGESNAFHGEPVDPNVLIHTHLVTDATIEMLQGCHVFEDMFTQLRFQTYLHDRLSTQDMTEGQMQLVVAQLQDIGKSRENVLKIDEQGSTRAPGYELVSAEMLPDIFEQLRSKKHVFSTAAMQAITQRIANNGIYYPLIIDGRDMAETDSDTYFSMENRMYKIADIFEIRHDLPLLASIFTNVLAELKAGKQSMTGERNSGFTQEHIETTKQLLSCVLHDMYQ